MTNILYTVIVHETEEDETGYWAEVRELPPVVTQGDTIEELMHNVADAIAVYNELIEEKGYKYGLYDPNRMPKC